MLLALLLGILTENRVVSSANNLGLPWRFSGKSLMYIGNKNRTNKEPGCKPALILTQGEL